jgi:hypothetical protein
VPAAAFAARGRLTPVVTIPGLEATGRSTSWPLISPVLVSPVAAHLVIEIVIPALGLTASRCSFIPTVVIIIVMTAAGGGLGLVVITVVVVLEPTALPRRSAYVLMITASTGFAGVAVPTAIGPISLVSVSVAAAIIVKWVIASRQVPLTFVIRLVVAPFVTTAAFVITGTRRGIRALTCSFRIVVFAAAAMARAAPPRGNLPSLAEAHRGKPASST